MEFLTMSGLVGGGLATIPVIIHILNRRRFQRVRWAAMEFLLVAEKITRKRVRVEHLLLLLIRTLLVLFLAWALANPILSGDRMFAFLETGNSGRNILFVLDDSYSMAAKGPGGTAYSQALDKIVSLLEQEQLKDEDRVSLIQTSAAYRWAQGGEKDPVSFLLANQVVLSSANRKTLMERMETLRETPLGLHTDFHETFRLLTAASEQMAKTDRLETRVNRQIVVLSDFRRYGWVEHARPDAAARPTVSKNNEAFAKLLETLTAGEDKQMRAQVTLLDVGQPAPENLSIDEVVLEGGNLPVSGTTILLSLTLHNRGAKDVKDLKLEYFVDQGQPASVKVPEVKAGKKVSVPIRVAPIAKAGPHLIRFVVSDALEVDSHYYYPLNLKRGIRALLVNGEGSLKTDKSEIFVLKYLLFPRAKVTAFRPFLEAKSDHDSLLTNTLTRDDLKTIKLESYDLIVLANTPVPAGGLNDPVTRALHQYVQRGGALIFFLGKKVNPDKFNAAYQHGPKGADGKEHLNQGITPALLGEPVGEAKADKPEWQLVLADVDHDVFQWSGRKTVIKMLSDSDHQPVLRRRFPLDRVSNLPAGDTITTLFNSNKVADLQQNLSPAIMLRTFPGGGSCVLFSFPSDAEWSDALSSPKKLNIMGRFMHRLVHYMAVRRAKTDLLDLSPGQPLEIQFRNYKQTTLLQGPKQYNPKKKQGADVSSSMLTAQKTAGIVEPHRSLVYKKTFEPGPYLAWDADKADQEKKVVAAVNVFLPESDLRRASDELLRKELPGFEFVMTNELKEISALKIDRWRWFMYAVLVLLVVESILAAAFSRSGARNDAAPGK